MNKTNKITKIKGSGLPTLLTKDRFSFHELANVSDKYKSKLISNKNQLSTIRTKLCAVRSFFEFLLEREYISKNIITKKVYPTVHKKRKNYEMLSN